MDIISLALAKKKIGSIDTSSFVKKEDLGQITDEEGQEVTVQEYIATKIQESNQIIDYDIAGGSNE